MDAGQVAVAAVGVGRRGGSARRARRVDDDHGRDHRGGQRAGDDRDPERGVRPVTGRRSPPSSPRRARRRPAARICRMPIASPRRRGGNQPTTTRPLAASVLAAASAGRGRGAQREQRRPPGAGTAASAADAVAPTGRPAGRSRSPRRSVTTAPGTSAHITPTIGAAATTPASASDRPSCSTQRRDQERRAVHHHRGRGLRRVPAASIAQRRVVPTCRSSAEMPTGRFNALVGAEPAGFLLVGL